MKMRSQTRALDKIYKRRDRYEIPDWQRSKVWSVNDKRRLIDTILRGWKLPKFYFQKTQEAPEEFDVVDGQQRLTAVFEFFDGSLKLDAKQAERFGSADYNGLPETISDAFDDFEIEYDEISDATDEEVKEFFQRLQAGLRLTTSEKLNSIHSKLRDFCDVISKHKFYSETTVVADKRHAYFDICAKVATIEVEGLDGGLRYDDIKLVFDSNNNFSNTSSAARRINAALDLLHSIFPRNYRLLRNRTIVQSIITLTCHIQKAGLTAPLGTKLKDFIEAFLIELGRQVELGQDATHVSFLEFQRTVNANVKSGARTRQSILLRMLFRAHPEMFSELSQSGELSEGIGADLANLSRSLREEVHATNEAYAGKHGKDLFKATNKTSSALGNLGVPATTKEQYKEFIDNLYFIFHEGVGERLSGQLPPSFSDVNALRTQLQHDVDHGTASKAASKRRALGQIFLRYAGAPSPDAVDPSQFAIAQVNLLDALRTDLRQLAKSV
jgi:hypothetical protein